MMRVSHVELCLTVVLDVKIETFHFADRVYIGPAIGRIYNCI